MKNKKLLDKIAEEAAQAPVAPPARKIPLGPVPTSWNISQGRTIEGGFVVVVSVQTAEGDKHFFLDPSMAQQLGEALLKMSSASDSGLILPQ